MQTYEDELWKQNQGPEVFSSCRPPPSGRDTLYLVEDEDDKEEEKENKFSKNVLIYSNNGLERKRAGFQKRTAC